MHDLCKIFSLVLLWGLKYTTIESIFCVALLYVRINRMLELHTLWIIMIYASLTRYAGITHSYKYIILLSLTKYIYNHLPTSIYFAYDGRI